MPGLKGVEPITPILQGSVAPIGMQARVNCRLMILDLRFTRGRYVPTNRQSAILNHQSKIDLIPDGVEPSSPACRAGVFAVGPRDRIVSDRGGNRTHRPRRFQAPTMPSDRKVSLVDAALPDCVPRRDVIAYIDFRNRSVHEMQSVNLTEGMIYDSFENLERTHDLSTHYSRARIFAPLNAIDCMLFGGEPPVLGITLDLQ